MNKQVPEGSHVLECHQMLFRDDTVFTEDQKKVSIPFRFAPTVKRYEIIANIDGLLDAQLNIALYKRARTDILFVLFPCDIFRFPECSQVFTELGYLSRKEHLVYHIIPLILYFTEKEPRVQVFGPRPNLLPNTLD
jgi:hypothetical protein